MHFNAANFLTLDSESAFSSAFSRTDCAKQPLCGKSTRGILAVFQNPVSRPWRMILPSTFERPYYAPVLTYCNSLGTCVKGPPLSITGARDVRRFESCAVVVITNNRVRWETRADCT